MNRSATSRENLPYSFFAQLHTEEMGRYFHIWLRNAVKSFGIYADNSIKETGYGRRKWSGDTEQAEQILRWRTGSIDGWLVRKGSNSRISDGKGNAGNQLMAFGKLHNVR